jgi:hypothetical protein
MGPHGRLLSRKDEDMMISGYHWNISDFETPVFGSYEALDLDRSLCSDRHSRYSAYGYTEGNETSRASEIDWEHVNWAQLQQECLQRNAARYSTTEPNQKSIWALYKSLDPELQQTPSSNSSSEHSAKPRGATQPQAEPRTAVILRSWIGMQYTEPDLFNIRSMIMELSLYSGGEYEVILLIDCQDQALPEENDEAAWTTFKDNLLPPELRGMAVFFNDDILWEWYPEIDVHAYVSFTRKRSLWPLTPF